MSNYQRSKGFGAAAAAVLFVAAALGDAAAHAAATQPARAARAASPRAGTLLSDGDIFEAGERKDEDPGNNRVRVVAARTGTFYGQHMTAGRIYTIAGTGAFGLSGDGGLATKAALDGPSGLAVDQAGNVIVVDAGNNRVRVIAEKTGSFYGVAMTKGRIYTIAGGGKSLSPRGPARQTRIFAAGAVVDPSGNILIAQNGQTALSAGSLVYVVASRTGKFYGQKMTAHHIYVIAGTGPSADTGDGGSARQATLAAPASIALWPGHGIMIADGLKLRLISGPG